RPRMPTTPPDEFSEREQALHDAARLHGLSLVRTGETFALVQYHLTGATLDEVADFLAADRRPDVDDHKERRADLRALLKAERALVAEFEARQRKTGEHTSAHETAA